MKRFLPLVFLTGCSSLGAIGAGLKTAEDVAKVACAALQGADSSAVVLARLADIQRQVVEQQAAGAPEKDRAAVTAMLRTLAALAEGQAATAKQLAAITGDRPATIVPCPGVTATP